MKNLLSNIVTGYLHALEVQPLILVYTLTSIIGIFLLILFIVQDKREQYKQARHFKARKQAQKHQSSLAM